MVSVRSYFCEKFPKFTFGCINNASSPPVLSQDDLEFIVDHTSITKDKIDQHYDNFLLKHPNGKISRKGFSHMMQQACLPNRDTTSQLESHIFRMYDSNGDGYVDFREFMIVLYVMSHGTPEENLKKIFQVFDINNDGTVSQKELDRVVKDLFQSFKKTKDDETDEIVNNEENLAKEAFKEMDVNIDGKITQEEFIHACLSRETLSTMLALKVIDLFL